MKLTAPLERVLPDDVAARRCGCHLMTAARLNVAPGAGLALLVIVLLAGFAAFCVVDLVRASQVRYLPKWGWALAICLSVPWGGLLYLGIGKVRRAPGAPWEAPVTEEGAAATGPAPRRVHASAPVIEVDQLTKRFGPVTAVDGLSFAVRPGQVTGFLGPNGAGKTTTMRVILGLDAPTSGRALVGGRRYAGLIRPLREVGSLLDASAVYGGRSAWFHLLSIAQSNGIGRHRVAQVLELTGLEAVAGKRLKGFSLGMKQRLGIAVALLADPPVLILDEPVNGAIGDLAAGKGIAVHELVPRHASLEEAYLDLTAGSTDYRAGNPAPERKPAR